MSIACACISAFCVRGSRRKISLYFIRKKKEKKEKKRKKKINSKEDREITEGIRWQLPSLARK
jgi:hypothetical protein